MLRQQRRCPGLLDEGLGRAVLLVATAPNPRIAKPQRRQQVQHRLLAGLITDGDPNQDVVVGRLGVLGVNVEIPPIVEHARVEDFEFRLIPAPPSVLLKQPFVGKSLLWVAIQTPHVGVRGRRVEVVVEFFYVLTVVALVVGQAEHALLQDRVLAVPQGQGEAQPALAVGQSEDAVLAPAICSAAGLVMREIAPSTTHPASSPPALCPIDARTDTAPSASNSSLAEHPPAADSSRHWPYRFRSCPFSDAWAAALSRELYSFPSGAVQLGFGSPPALFRRWEPFPNAKDRVWGPFLAGRTAGIILGLNR